MLLQARRLERLGLTGAGESAGYPTVAIYQNRNCGPRCSPEVRRRIECSWNDSATIRFLALASPNPKNALIVAHSACSKLAVSCVSTQNEHQVPKMFVLRNSLRNLPCGSNFLSN